MKGKKKKPLHPHVKAKRKARLESYEERLREVTKKVREHKPNMGEIVMPGCLNCKNLGAEVERLQGINARLIDQASAHGSGQDREDFYLDMLQEEHRQLVQFVTSKRYREAWWQFKAALDAEAIRNGKERVIKGGDLFNPEQQAKAAAKLRALWKPVTRWTIFRDAMKDMWRGKRNATGTD